MQPLLALKGIDKSFPGVKALSGAALNVYPGRVMALVGENGAGKSTMMKVLTGIYQKMRAPKTSSEKKSHLTALNLLRKRVSASSIKSSTSFHNSPLPRIFS